jgi:hypothetical protein
LAVLLLLEDIFTLLSGSRDGVDWLDQDELFEMALMASLEFSPSHTPERMIPSQGRRSQA